MRTFTCSGGTSPVVVKPKVTASFPIIDYSWRVGWSPEFPEFPHWEAEGGVLQPGDQTGRAGWKKQVSVSSVFEHLFAQLCLGFFLICRLLPSSVAFLSLHETVVCSATLLFIPSICWTSMSSFHKASSIQAVWTEHVNILHTAFQSDLFSC